MRIMHANFDAFGSKPKQIIICGGNKKYVILVDNTKIFLP